MEKKPPWEVGNRRHDEANDAHEPAGVALRSCGSRGGFSRDEGWSLGHSGAAAASTARGRVEWVDGAVGLRQLQRRLAAVAGRSRRTGATAAR